MPRNPKRLLGSQLALTAAVLLLGANFPEKWRNSMDIESQQLLKKRNTKILKAGLIGSGAIGFISIIELLALHFWGPSSFYAKNISILLFVSLPYGVFMMFTGFNPQNVIVAHVGFLIVNCLFGFVAFSLPTGLFLYLKKYL